jgi:hypothetical protein
MKKLLLASTLAIASFPGYAAEPAVDPGIEDQCRWNAEITYDDPACKPKPVRFQPMQWVFQCNDIRATITWRERDVWEYDLGGSIIGGSRFVQAREGLYFNGRPCTLIARWPR